MARGILKFQDEPPFIRWREMDCFAGARNDEVFSRRVYARALLTTTRQR
jgi:hypothetical protein